MASIKEPKGGARPGDLVLLKGKPGRFYTSATTTNDHKYEIIYVVDRWREKPGRVWQYTLLTIEVPSGNYELTESSWRKMGYDEWDWEPPLTEEKMNLEFVIKYGALQTYVKDAIRTEMDRLQELADKFNGYLTTLGTQTVRIISGE